MEINLLVTMRLITTDDVVKYAEIKDTITNWESLLIVVAAAMGVRKEEEEEEEEEARIEIPNNTSRKRKRGSKAKNGTSRRSGRSKRPKVDLKSIAFPNELPQYMKRIVEEMNGVRVMEVTRKVLTSTDLKRNNGRLSIVRQQCTKNFLTEEEELVLEQQSKEERRKKKANPVVLIDPRGRKFEPNLRKWKMTSSEILAFSTEWNKLAMDNDFKIDDVIQLWTFLSGARRCFAMVMIQRAIEQVRGLGDVSPAAETAIGQPSSSTQGTGGVAGKFDDDGNEGK